MVQARSRILNHLRSAALNEDLRRKVASYLARVPLEDSSGNRRRLGHITKRGSSMLRFLLVKAAQVTVRSLPKRRSRHFSLDDEGTEDQ